MQTPGDLRADRLRGSRERGAAAAAMARLVVRPRPASVYLVVVLVLLNRPVVEGEWLQGADACFPTRRRTFLSVQGRGGVDPPGGGVSHSTVAGAVGGLVRWRRPGPRDQRGSSNSAFMTSSVAGDHEAGDHEGADALGATAHARRWPKSVPAGGYVAQLVDVAGVFRGDEHFGGHLSALQVRPIRAPISW